MSIEFERSLEHITGETPIKPSLLYGFSVISAEDLNRFQSAWPQIPDERRQQIMKSMVEITEHSFEVSYEPIFIIGLDDDLAEVQALAIEGLWESELPSLIPPLVHLLKTGRTTRVRTTAATALGQYIYLGELEEIDETSYSVAHQALLQTIRNDNEETDVIRRAIEAISFSVAPGIPQIIENAYYNDNELMQVSAIFAMGRHGDTDRWGKLVLTELDNHKSAIRFEAARAAGELQLNSAVPRLIEMIAHEADSEIQQNAIWSLGQIGGDEAREALEILLENEDEAIQTAAEDALDELAIWSGQNLDDIFSYAIGTDDDDDMHIVDLNGR